LRETVSLDHISITGAREHNLKNIDVQIPRDQLVVITGVSGSGKSSLAFDTIYAEGQRRYVESLSAYARQFLGLMEKPDVDAIEGLSPAISIDQKGVSKNPRSTVATVTEIYDYLRLLFARIGIPHCLHCDRVIERQTTQEIVDNILNQGSGLRGMLLSPLIRHRRGEHQQIIRDIRSAGYIRARIDGQIVSIDEDINLERNKWHDIDIVVDRVNFPNITDVDFADDHQRITDSVEQALMLSKGTVILTIVDDNGDIQTEETFSEHFSCSNPDHSPYSVGEIEPRNFSFNSPHGACSSCTGLGIQLEFAQELIIPNLKLSLSEGAIVPFHRNRFRFNWYQRQLIAAGEALDFDMDTPIDQCSSDQMNALMYGSNDETITVEFQSRKGRKREYNIQWDGILSILKKRYLHTESDSTRTMFEQFMISMPCPTCDGARLKSSSIAVRITNRSIVDVVSDSVLDVYGWIEKLSAQNTELSGREQQIAHQILQEIEGRLRFLKNVGLDYLNLNRAAGTLSGGEGQRIRLATQIGSALMGVLYVCDEPSIGLHPVDNDRLIQTLTNLRDLGNTVLIVEHDEAMMRAADHLIDIGPGAGEHGGTVVAVGTPTQVSKQKKSLTGQYLSGKKIIPMPETRRNGNGNCLIVRGAKANNLKKLNVSFPLGMFIAVTGVSGSGKSTLVNEILAKRLAYDLNGARELAGEHETIEGLEHLDKVIVIDQTAIGRTPRSNTATYTGLFTLIRELFAQVPEARARGYKPGRFSFNVKGGRCEACRGDGYTLIEMQFLPDVMVACEVCEGSRYNREALEILFRGKHIADVLDMTVAEAFDFFEAFPRPKRKLDTLVRVGLGYMKLGQPATTLSGGEAQRVKLATELSKRATGRTMYILDEPTTGLSFHDTAQLLEVLQTLVDGGNTVVVIEHHLDVIKNADWVIDLGPKGGAQGGKILAEGTPELISKSKVSQTGQFLKNILSAVK